VDLLPTTHNHHHHQQPKKEKRILPFSVPSGTLSWRAGVPGKERGGEQKLTPVFFAPSVRVSLPPPFPNFAIEKPN
jgi:hypothetical protein